ncbi:MAG: glycosyltransferase family 4 protein, partial [Clostridia bacterium]|nr:glycosyltransferase family 4 protein [Clostridia bacterium]
MKIAIIGHKRIPSNEGGIEKGVEQHAVRMAERGHTVIAYNRGSGHIYGKKYDSASQKNYKNVRIVKVPTLSGAAEVPIYSFLATLHAIFSRVDVISYRASGSCNMVPFAKFFGIRTIASLHGIDSQRDKWKGFAVKYLERGEKMAATKADVCLVLSENERSYIEQRYHRKPFLFANGINRPVPQAPDVIREKYGLSEGDYILSLGRGTPEKGLHYLIKAFKAIETDKKLVIAGGMDSAEYEAELHALAADDPRVIFTGFVQGKEKDELYSNAFVYCMPSNLEGMANTLLEALSFGNCCLLSNIPENMEPAGDHAVYFHKGDVDDLRLKLAYLLDHPDEVRRYKADAADYV